MKLSMAKLSARAFKAAASRKKNAGSVPALSRVSGGIKDLSRLRADRWSSTTDVKNSAQKIVGHRVASVSLTPRNGVHHVVVHDSKLRASYAGQASSAKAAMKKANQVLKAKRVAWTERG